MKKVLTILLCIMIIVTFLQIMDTFALYRSEIKGKFTTPTGKWLIKVNNASITTLSTKKFTITEDNMEFLASNTVADNRIAPNVGMYFDIEIDPSETDVAIKYTVSIDAIEKVVVNSLPKNVNFISIEVTSIEQTRTYSNGNSLSSSEKVIDLERRNITNIIPLEDINTGCKDNIRIYFKWKNNEETNEKEAELIAGNDCKLRIPVSATFTQYLGEEL